MTGMKTQPYSSSGEVDKTQAYDSTSGRTEAYEIGSSGKTTGYDDSAAERTDQTDAHGIRIGDEIELKGKKYHIDEIISGDQRTLEAVIYKISDAEGKEYTLKLYYKFRNPKNEPNPEALDRIRKINDADILKLYDYGTGADKYQGKFCFEICDYARGSDLLSVTDIKKKYTPDFIKSNVIPEIFKGIRTLHDYKIYHCDLKPENVLFLDEAQTDLIIGDYGSAKTFDEASEKESSRTSRVLGSDFYLAPEQARGIVSKKNDYHAFGMILLHLVYPDFVNKTDLDKMVVRQGARKPIIDYDPQHGDLNSLIAGLTLADSTSRWGEEEVKAWLRGEKVEVNYNGSSGAQVQPINLGKTIIQTVDDLVGYVENEKEWYENLIKDNEGYTALLLWVQSIQGQSNKRIFDKMVRNYLQENKEYVKEYVYQTILRYFDPVRPIRVDMKLYDLWKTENLAKEVDLFIRHIDDLWKNTDLKAIRFYFFQLEFVLRQIRKDNDQKILLVNSLLEKISSAFNPSMKQEFDDYLCGLYSIVNNRNLISLFYTFDLKRTFKDLQNKSYSTLEEIAFFFAKNESLFDNKYLKLENKYFIKKWSLNNLENLSYSDFLFTIFNKEIKSEIKILDLDFENPSEGNATIRYQFGKSLSDYFQKNGINNDISTSIHEKKMTLYIGAVPLINRILKKFVKWICDNYKINKETLSNSSMEKSKEKIKQKTTYYYNESFMLFNFSFWLLFFYALMAYFFSINIFSVILEKPVFNIDLVYKNLFNFSWVNFANFQAKSFIDVLYGLFVPFAIPALFFTIPIAFITWLKYPYNSEVFNLGIWDSGDWDFSNWDWDNEDRLKFSTYIGIPVAFLISPIIILILAVGIFIAEAIIAIPAWIIFCGFGGLEWKDLEALGEVILALFSLGIPIVLLFSLIFISVSTLITKLNQEKFIFKNIAYWASAIVSMLFFILIIISFNHDEANANLPGTRQGHSAIQKKDIFNENQNNTPLSKKEYGRVDASAANIRSGPSTNNSIVSVLQRGEGFEILSSNNGWSKIRFKGKEGFLYNQLIQKTKNIRTPKFKVGYHQAANASIQKIRIVPGATHITLHVEKGKLHKPSHNYGMYLFDKRTYKKYLLVSASIPFEKTVTKKTFDVIFEEIPGDVTSFDLIEGKCTKGCWTFKSIKLL